MLINENGMPFALKNWPILAYYAFLLCVVFPCDTYLRKKARISLLGTFDVRRIPKKRQWTFVLGILGSLVVFIYPLVFLLHPRLVEFTRLFAENLAQVPGLALISFGMFVDLVAISRLVVSRSQFPEPDVELLTTGIYRLARNPVYVGAYVSLFGILCLLPTGIYLVGLILYALGNHVRVLQEEEYLRARFGHAYEAYCRSVARYWPRIRGEARIELFGHRAPLAEDSELSFGEGERDNRAPTLEQHGVRIGNWYKHLPPSPLCLRLPPS